MKMARESPSERRDVGGRREDGSPLPLRLPARRVDEDSLGARIRALRKERGLTLDALGRLAGVTRSFLSQVENCQSSPSIQTLRNIAMALDTPVFALLEDQQDHRKVVRKNERKRIRAPHARVEYELLSPDLRRAMEVIMVELEPGQVSAARPVTHRGEECATVLQGIARVEVGDEQFDLEEGDTIYFESDLPHRVINPGTIRMCMISAITPPSF